MSGFEELIYPHHFKAQLLIDVKGLLLIVELLYFSLCTQQGRSQKNPWQVGLGGCCVLVLHLFNFLSNFKDFLSLLKHCCTLICNQCLMFIFLSFQSTTKLLYKQSSAGCSDIDDVSLAVLRYVHTSYSKWQGRDLAKQSVKKVTRFLDALCSEKGL